MMSYNPNEELNRQENTENIENTEDTENREKTENTGNIGNTENAEAAGNRGESIGGSYLTREGMLATFRWEDGELRFLSLYDGASDRYAAMDPAGGTVSVRLDFKGGGQSMSPWALALVQGALNKGGVQAVEQLPGIAVEHQSGGTVVISETAPGH